MYNLYILRRASLNSLYIPRIFNTETLFIVPTARYDEPTEHNSYLVPCEIVRPLGQLGEGDYGPLISEWISAHTVVRFSGWQFMEQKRVIK